MKKWFLLSLLAVVGLQVVAGCAPTVSEKDADTFGKESEEDKAKNQDTPSAQDSDR